MCGESKLRHAQSRRRETGVALCPFKEVQPCSSTCPSFDLCNKRVLIVGGIARMESLYRKLVEENGGILDYHEGHMKGGGRQLESSFQRADLVLCPVNCNSHGACSLVKQLGKKHNKLVCMMSNFSLSAISRIIGTQDEEPVQGTAL